ERPLPRGRADSPPCGSAPRAGWRGDRPEERPQEDRREPSWPEHTLAIVPARCECWADEGVPSGLFAQARTGVATTMDAWRALLFTRPHEEGVGWPRPRLSRCPEPKLDARVA